MPAAKKKAAAPRKEAVAPAPEETLAVSEVTDERPVIPLKPGEVKLQPLQYQRWVAFVPPYYTAKHLESERLWAFMASKITDMDRCEIIAEDGSWICEVFIRRNIGRSLTIQVIPDSRKQLTPSAINQDVEIFGHAIRWAGPSRRFIAINQATKEVLRENLNTQMEAIQYVTDHIKAKH